MNGKKRLLFEKDKKQESDSDRHEVSTRFFSAIEANSGTQSRCSSVHSRQGGWEGQDLKYPSLKSLFCIKFVPKPEDIFSMFDMLNPEEIKVVIMGQDPYPGKCSITGIEYACGPAFKIPNEVKSCPQSLKNLFIELKTDVMGLSSKRSITLDYVKKHIKHWISQGVFLTNASLTRGSEGTYLDDHKMFWMNFTISFIRSIKNSLIVLLGSEAWKFEKFVHQGTKVMKFYHPVSRDKKFFNCKMFTKINECISGDKIKWVM